MLVGVCVRVVFSVPCESGFIDSFVINQRLQLSSLSCYRNDTETVTCDHVRGSHVFNASKMLERGNVCSSPGPKHEKLKVQCGGFSGI